MSKQVVLGVGGGIAAYKACDLLRRLTEAGHSVRVVPTDSALRFVGAATWEALSGQPVSSQVWDHVPEVPHVQLGRQADLVVIAPATANLLAKAATGQADDLLTATLLTTRAPVVFAPAMHTEMWEHPATRANVAALRERGAIVLDPAVGRLTGADSGAGRLPEPASLMAVCTAVLDRGDATADLSGLRVLISGGGTREPLDPVRYLGNLSSGRQAWAVAAAAVARGAHVHLVAANVDAPDPAGTTVTKVRTAAQLRDAMLSEVPAVDVVVMAAAVADFRPVRPSTTKIKKTADGAPPAPLELERTVDVLAEIGHLESRPFLVGFAAETVESTASLVDLANDKLRAKGADLIVGNQVGADRGFESADNAVMIVSAQGVESAVGLTSKEGVANAIWDVVASRLSTR